MSNPPRHTGPASQRIFDPPVMLGRVTMADCRLRSTRVTRTLNTQGSRTDNLYDHVLVHDPNATAEMIGNAVVLDVRGVSSSPKDFYQTVSDHLPIMVRMRAGGPDDD